MKIFLDACVLFPTVTREMLLGVARAGVFEPQWSPRVLEEWARAALKIGPEAEVFARGGIKDVMVSNQVTEPAKIKRLAEMPKYGCRVLVCVDDPENVKALSDAAVAAGTQIEALVEIDCGAGRCGVNTSQDVVRIAKLIDAAPGLKFAGIQAYQGAMQHMDL